MKNVRGAKASGQQSSAEINEQDGFAKLLAEMDLTFTDDSSPPDHQEMLHAVNDIISGMIKYRAVAKRHKLDFLAYLIEMAGMESLEILSKSCKK